MQAVGWTIGFLLLTLLFSKRRKRFVARIEKLTVARFTGFEEATNAVVKGKAVGRLIGFVVSMVLWIGYLFLLYYYLTFVLLSFVETQPFAQLPLTYVSQPLIDVL